tara:strand:- start:259 stop:471 length:213 start_codon:yes stop_codon:yes gene_type:complete
MNRNLKALKSVYLIAKGTASLNEIIELRNKYRIAASKFSLILGLSKNTIYYKWVTFISSGRLIKICIIRK